MVLEALTKRLQILLALLLSALLLAACSQPPAEYTDNSRKIYKRSATTTTQKRADKASYSYQDSYYESETHGNESNDNAHDENHDAIFEDDLHDGVEAALNSENFALDYPMGNHHFMWPLDGKVIAHYNKDAGREGLNIVADINTPVKSAAAGKVIYVGEDLAEYGKLVIIKHDNEILTAYAHLDSTNVNKGDIVQKGQKIGAVGHSGDVSAPQLHFSIRKRDFTINPEKSY